jgi:pimeloyl-ACP methyl ester carboxylesterase
VDQRLNSTGRSIQRTTAMHGEDDQICPFPATGARSVKLLKHGTLKSYPGLPHGVPTTHADQINADLLAFVQQQSGERAA